MRRRFRHFTIARKAEWGPMFRPDLVRRVFLPGPFVRLDNPKPCEIIVPREHPMGDRCPAPLPGIPMPLAPRAAFVVLLLAGFGALAADAPPAELETAQGRYEAQLAEAEKKADADLVAELAKLKKKAMADGRPELALFCENAAKDPGHPPPSPPREWAPLQKARDEALGRAAAQIHKRQIADLTKLRDRQTAAGLLDQAVAADLELKEVRQALSQAAPTAADIQKKLTGQTWAWDTDATLLFRERNAADYAYIHHNYVMTKGGRKVPPHRKLVSTDRVNKKFFWTVDNPRLRQIKCAADGHTYLLALTPSLTAADVYEGGKKLRRIACVAGGKEAQTAPPAPPELAVARRTAQAAFDRAAKKAGEEGLVALADLRKKAMAAGNPSLAVAVDGDIKALKASPADGLPAGDAPAELAAVRQRHRQALGAAAKAARESEAAELAAARKKAMADLNLDRAVALDRRIRELQSDPANAAGDDEGKPDADGKEK